MHRKYKKCAGRASLNMWYYLLTKLKTNHESVSRTILRLADNFSRVIPFPGLTIYSSYGSFISRVGNRMIPFFKHPKSKHCKILTLHDLLEFHLEGLHSSARMVSCSSFNSMDRKTALHHCCNIVIFKKDDTIGVLYHCTTKWSWRCYQ